LVSDPDASHPPSGGRVSAPDAGRIRIDTKGHSTSYGPAAPGIESGPDPFRGRLRATAEPFHPRDDPAAPIAGPRVRLQLINRGRHPSRARSKYKIFVDGARCVSGPVNGDDRSPQGPQTPLWKRYGESGTTVAWGGNAPKKVRTGLKAELRTAAFESRL